MRKKKKIRKKKFNFFHITSQRHDFQPFNAIYIELSYYIYNHRFDCFSKANPDFNFSFNNISNHLYLVMKNYLLSRITNWFNLYFFLEVWILEFTGRNINFLFWLGISLIVEYVEYSTWWISTLLFKSFVISDCKYFFGFLIIRYFLKPFFVTSSKIK